jgi:hypothetical protein
MVTVPPSLRSLEASSGDIPIKMAKTTKQHDTKDGEEDKKQEQGGEELALDEYGDLSILLPLLMEKGKGANLTTTASIDEDNDGVEGWAEGTVTTAEGAELDEKIVLDAREANIPIRVVLERYGMALIRDQVAKVRNLLRGNAPYIASLVGGGRAEKEGINDNMEEKKMARETAAVDKSPSKDAAAVPAVDPVSDRGDAGAVIVFPFKEHQKIAV